MPPTQQDALTRFRANESKNVFVVMRLGEEDDYK
jgi:hypothetical protein